jgi:MinD superfamily P-loop ATPase
MIVTVASGKGGTGKTLVATSLALSLQEKEGVRFLDCDVEEPNAAIFLRPAIESSEPVTIPVPEIDMSKCTHCGVCAGVCVYHAIAALAGAYPGFPRALPRLRRLLIFLPCRGPSASGAVSAALSTGERPETCSSSRAG